MTPPTKRCCNCGPRPVTEFGYCAAKPDKLQPLCRTCARQASRRGHHLARERRLAREVAYRVALATQRAAGVVMGGG